MQKRSLLRQLAIQVDFYIPDFDQFAELAAKHSLPLVIDNTFGGAGYLFKPKDHGTSIITHAATKWIGGHGNSIAGIVVDCGNFDWSNGKFRDSLNASESYHGLKFWETFGEGSLRATSRFNQSARRGSSRLGLLIAFSTLSYCFKASRLSHLEWTES